MKRILIGADFVPSEINVKYFTEGKLKEIIEPELYEIMTKADYKIYNLEMPLTDNFTPIVKWAGNLIAPTAAINGYKEMGVNLFVTSNNHILDQKRVGLESTFKTLDAAGINHVGTGMSYEEACKPFIFKIEDKSIGVYNCCEHEFCGAQEYGFGANLFDPFESLDQIKELSEKVDYLIVLYHGGKEHYRYPSPYLQKCCRKIAEKGADLVICQHTHCIGAFEDYDNSKIIYGQGNTLFAYDFNEYWASNLLVALDYDGKKFDINYIPVYHTAEGGLLLDKTGVLLKDFYHRSKQITEKDFVKENYVKFCESAVEEYLPRIAELMPLALINYMDCEPHRELITTAMKAKTFEKDN